MSGGITYLSPAGIGFATRVVPEGGEMIDGHFVPEKV